MDLERPSKPLKPPRHAQRANAWSRFEKRTDSIVGAHGLPIPSTQDGGELDARQIGTLNLSAATEILALRSLLLYGEEDNSIIKEAGTGIVAASMLTHPHDADAALRAVPESLPTLLHIVLETLCPSFFSAMA